MGDLPWVHFVGLYLLIGTLCSGLGLIAKIRMAGHTKPIFPNRRAMIWFGIGVVIGILFWPAGILCAPLMAKWMTRRLRRRDKS